MWTRRRMQQLARLQRFQSVNRRKWRSDSDGISRPPALASPLPWKIANRRPAPVEE